jgi:hypothetical protein
MGPEHQSALEAAPTGESIVIHGAAGVCRCLCIKSLTDSLTSTGSGKTCLLEVIIRSLRLKWPNMVIVSASNGAITPVAVYFELDVIFTDSSAFRLGGVHLDQVIGHSPPNASIPQVVSIIQQSPEMAHLLTSSRVIVIDDGKPIFSFAPAPNHKCLTFMQQSIW